MIFDTCLIVPEYIESDQPSAKLFDLLGDLGLVVYFGIIPKCNPLERIKNHQLALMILAIGQTFLIGGLLYFEIIPK